MNKAQREYLDKYCERSGKTEEQALKCALIKGVMEQLALKLDEPLTLENFEARMKCNCS